MQYNYVVRERVFTGRNIWLTAGQSFASPEEARAFLGPYRVGSRVRVFYDPVNPGDAALIIQRGSDPMALLIIIGLWGLIGTFHYPRAGDQMPWVKLLRQMALSAVLVSVGYIICILVVGEGCLEGLSVRHSFAPLARLPSTRHCIDVTTREMACASACP